MSKESSSARSQSIDSLETALKNTGTIQGKMFFLPQVQKSVFSLIQLFYGLYFYSGADPGFFLGGGAHVSSSTSTPINHIVFFLAEYQLY